MTTTAIDLRHLNMSQHAINDRMDRLVSCIQAVGVGEIVFACKSNRTKYADSLVVNCVTSTGLVLIIDIAQNRLITGYLGTVPRVMGLYKSSGLDRMPDWLFKLLRKNEKKFSFLLTN
jgi:hypothetical protein